MESLLYHHQMPLAHLSGPVVELNSTLQYNKPSSVYAGHLEHQGEDCSEHCSHSSGYCDYCGVGNVCCAPLGSDDSGSHHEVCKHTRDWSNSWYSRRRHHVCEEGSKPPLTPEEEAIDVPFIRTSSHQAFKKDNANLDNALKMYGFVGKVVEMVRVFEFIPYIFGYLSQFKLPKGDFETTSCDLESISKVLQDNSRVELIGSGYSYYLQKRTPEALSISMQGCKCVEVDPDSQSATFCAASTMADALELLELHGLKIRTMGTYHHLSFGGAIAVFNHGSDHRYDSLVDTLNWMEYYDLETERFENETNLSKIKQVVAKHSYIMTRANVQLERDFKVVSVHMQSKGHAHFDERFLASLEDIGSLHVFTPYEADGSYVAAVSGYKVLTEEQTEVLSKRNYRPHACALRYRDCSTFHFLLGVADSEEILSEDDVVDTFKLDLAVDGHIVNASEVQFSWALEDAFGQRLFSEVLQSFWATSRSWEFELCIRGIDIPLLLLLWHEAVQAWPNRLAHTVGARRGACIEGVCNSWAGFYYLGDWEDFVKLWTQVMEVFKEYEIYVHLGKERVKEVKPHREVSMP